MRRNPFNDHRFRPDAILLAVRGYFGFHPSHRDVGDPPSGRGIDVDQAPVFPRTQKFGPEIAKRACNRRSRRGPSSLVPLRDIAAQRTLGQRTRPSVRVGGKWRNDRIESDRAALKLSLGTRRPFRSLRSARTTLMAIETIRTVKRGPIRDRHPGVRSEVDLARTLFGVAAQAMETAAELSLLRTMQRSPPGYAA